MNLYDFLDTICSQIKYKSIHDSIRAELGNHIEETVRDYMKSGMKRDEAVLAAVRQMGDAGEIGFMFNNQYRMPFNSRFGLAIWAAIVTVVIYSIYPFMYRLWKIIKIPYNDFVILGIIVLFMVLNVLYLRRGRKIIAVRDMLQVTTGFLIGWVVAATALIGTSYFNAPMYYAYMPGVKILFAFPYLPFLPKDSNALGMEGFCWWMSMIVYMISVKSRKHIKPSLIYAENSHYFIQTPPGVGAFHRYVYVDVIHGEDIDPY